MGTKTDSEYFKKHVALGTWRKCYKDGRYVEHKITEQYMLILTSTRPDEIIIFGNKVLDESLILYQLKNGTKILTNNDTLVTVKKSRNKVVLKSNYTWDYTELNRADFEFDEIDSTDLESWEKKVFSEFKKRAVLKNCPDLRTKSEKMKDEIDTSKLKLDELEPEEIIKN